MIKVLIADDEVKVCKLIENLIDWEALGLKIIGIANDGITALKIIEKERPQIVVTDIRMPGYDGIELIRRVKEVDKTIDIIIVSGYKHFDYAHNAIKYGVEDYLLKPLKKIEFTDTLKKMMERYKQRDKDRSEKELLKSQMKNDIEKLHYGFMVGLFLKESISDNLLEINNQYHFSFKPGSFQIIVVKADIGYKEINENAFKLLTDKAKSIIKKHLKDNCYEIVIYSVNKKIYALLNFDIEEKKNLRKQFKNIIDEIITLNDLFLDITATIGTGNIVQNIGQLQQSLESSERAIDNRIVMGTGKIIECSSIKEVNIKVMDILDGEKIRQFTGFIEILEVEEIKNWLSEIFACLQKKREITGELILKISNNIIELFLFTVKKNNFVIEDEEAFLENCNESLGNCYSISQISGLVSYKILREIANIISLKKQADTRPIRQAKQYIQKKYDSPLTLEEVSGIVGFNPTYFSHIFKRETGLGFLEYLSMIRVNKAKELLLETNDSIADISEAVGYMDLKHFSKLFKKLIGLKPSEYRKIYK